MAANGGEATSVARMHGASACVDTDEEDDQRLDCGASLSEAEEGWCEPESGAGELIRSDQVT